MKGVEVFVICAGHNGESIGVEKQDQLLTATARGINPQIRLTNNLSATNNVHNFGLKFSIQSRKRLRYCIQIVLAQSNAIQKTVSEISGIQSTEFHPS